MKETKDLPSIMTSHEPLGMRYFVFKYGVLPNEITMDINTENDKFIEAMEKILGGEIIERYTEQNISMLTFDENGNKGDDTIAIDFVLRRETFVSINWRGDQLKIYFKSEKCPYMDQIMGAIKEATKGSENEANFYMLSNDGGYLSLRRMNFKYDDKYSTEDLYNDDLIEKKDLIDDFVSNAKSGLMLFHGNPGTGKTSYIKSLIRKYEGEVKFIYMPNQMFAQLEAPSFINFFANHQDSIIVIEDAEALLTERKEGNTSISTLLNLTDGMLGEALRIKVVCTFNCDINQIDSALKRKGRLKFSYDFKELSVEKTNALLEKAGHNHTSESPMTLTDIINFDEEKYETEEKPTIGFGRRNQN